MRKIVSLGLLAISFGFFSSQTLAGNVEDCEVLVGGTPGLYGLCVAWHNAGNDNSRDRIMKNYDKKREPGDPDLPGSGDAILCPCWGQTEILNAVCNYNVKASSSGFVVFGDGNELQFFNFETDPTFCVYSDFTGTPVSIQLATTPEESLTCAAQISLMADGSLIDQCP